MRKLKTSRDRDQILKIEARISDLYERMIKSYPESVPAVVFVPIKE